MPKMRAASHIGLMEPTGRSSHTDMPPVIFRWLSSFTGVWSTCSQRPLIWRTIDDFHSIPAGKSRQDDFQIDFQMIRLVLPSCCLSRILYSKRFDGADAWKVLGCFLSFVLMGCVICFAHQMFLEPWSPLLLGSSKSHACSHCTTLAVLKCANISRFLEFATQWLVRSSHFQGKK